MEKRKPPSRRRFGWILALAIVAGGLYLIGSDEAEPIPEVAKPASAGAAVESTPGGEADAPGDAPVKTAIRAEEPQEGQAEEGLAYGSGFEEVELTEVYEPDQQVAITRSARPIRPVRKQDVYGRVLSSDFYFYRNLLSSSERALYDQIYANAIELDPEFRVSGVQVPRERLEGVLQAVRFDNPDLFWLSHQFQYGYNSSGIVTSVKLMFYDCVNDLEAYKDAFYGCTDSVLEQVMHLSSDVDKVKYIHDILIHLNDYSFGPMNQSAYSAVCYGETVCAGYASAFQYYMQRLGIPSAIVCGQAGERHVWNIVYLGGEFYAVDVTWDDPIGNPANTYYYRYFNVTDGALGGTHTRFSPATKLPGASGTRYSYANHYGSAPGSDFDLMYGAPSAVLPPVYPGDSPSYEVPEAQEPIPAEPTGPKDADGGETSDYGLSEEVEDDYDIYYEFYDWSDEEWEVFWDYMEETLTEEELAIIMEMEWPEFFELMEEAYRAS